MSLRGLAAALILAVSPGALAAGSAGPRLRDVDWANRDYGRHMTLRDGSYTMRRYPRAGSPVTRRCRHTTQSAQLVETRYGDVSGDGDADAVVQIRTYADHCNGRASDRMVFIAFARGADGPVELGRTSIWGVERARLARGHLVVTRRESDRKRSLRCTDRWRVRGTELALVKSRCGPVPRKK